MSGSKTNSSKSRESSSFIEYFDGFPSELQDVIMRKLAQDRTSFVAWSFARRSNLKDFKDPLFWKSLIESEGRHVRPKDALKPGKLINIYHRRCYNSVEIDGDYDCVPVSVLCELFRTGLCGLCVQYS